MRTIKISLLISLISTLICCNIETNNFVQVDGSQFILKNKPYYYFGANFWHGAYLGSELVKGDKERLLRELDLLSENNITNLRIMAASEHSVLERSVKPAFQKTPGALNDRLLEGLDFLLAEMAKRDMKAVLVLNNYWQWSGGMSQYISWNKNKPVIDPDLTGDWDGFQFQSSEFYTDSLSNAQFRNYIYALVNRKNTNTGIVYKNDPTIMSWQLANEPRPAPDAATNTDRANEFINWVIGTSEYIKSIAPNQLVSSGNEGVQGCRLSEDIYIKAHNTTAIDYLTFHIWPKNWGWFDANNADTTFNNALTNTHNYFSKHIAIARKLNKPTILEEFGLERDNGSFSKETTTAYRDKYLSIMFESVVDSAKVGSPMAGLNFWAWGGEATASHDDYTWRKGDSFMGDPPQEPQGLNSVFSTDTTTLQVFKKYNEKLKQFTKQ